MTKKKRPSVTSLLTEANEHIQKLEQELEEARKPRDARPHATPGGPNHPDAIYPPACGPMQLVWAAGTYGTCVMGVQCDSFRLFESRQKAADWLRAQARRIEEWDTAINEAKL